MWTRVNEWLALAVAVLLVGVLTAGTLEARPAGQTYTVQVGTSLSPALVRVEIGDVVKFRVTDQNRHRLRESGGHFDSGVLGPGEVYTFTVSDYPAVYYEYQVVDTFTGAEMRVCVTYCNTDFFWVYLPLVTRGQ